MMAVGSEVGDPSLTAVLEASQSARDQALGLVDMVHGDQDVSQEDIVRQQKLLTTNLSHLRGLHRAACFAARETKTATAEARQEVDRLHLQLQNLYYEQRHLQGEIEACESFK
jgi:THO complex subunit 5